MSLGAAKAALLGAAGSGGAANPDVSNLVLAGSISVAAEAAAPSGVHVRPDGLKMYVLDTSTNYIYQYSLSVAFDITTATYDSVFFDFVWDIGTDGLTFSDDGLNLLVTQFASTAAVMHLVLSVAWDLSTATVGTQYAVAAAPKGVAYSADGSKMLVTYLTLIQEYLLATPFSLASVTVGGTYSLTAETSLAYDMAFSEDGTKIYMVEDAAIAVNNVFQYTMSTPWDITTATYDGVAFDIGAADSAPTSLCLVAGMQNLYMVGKATDAAYQYDTGI